MQVQATARWVRVPARKARLVANVVEGMPVAEALTVLDFMSRDAAEDVAKVVKSAAANAETNFNLERERLQLLRVEVDGGPIIKRNRPRARAVVEDSLERQGRTRARPVRASGPPASANAVQEEEE